MYSNYELGKEMKKTTLSGFLADVKALVKGIVLVANVLPILSGFWLALFVVDVSFFEYWDKFIYMTIESVFLMAGALILNNEYEVDLDKEMDRTQERPTVTEHFSLQAVLTLGIVASVLGLLFLFFTTFEAAVYGFIVWFTYVVLYTFWTKRKYT